MDNSENNYEVLMSPLLANKITSLEDKLNNLEVKLDKILEKDTNIENIPQEIKKYTSVL